MSKPEDYDEDGCFDGDVAEGEDEAEECPYCDGTGMTNGAVAFDCPNVVEQAGTNNRRY